MHQQVAGCRFWVLLGWFALCGTGSAVAQIPSPNSSQLNLLKRVQFRMVSGRITVGRNYPSRSTSTTSTTSGSTRQHLSVRLSSDQPAIHYQLTSQEQSLSIDIAEREMVTIHCTPQGESKVVPFTFAQTTQGGLVFRWGSGADAQEHQAPSLWHLLLAEPEACREHLLPVLHFLRPDWGLEATAGQLAELLTSSDAPLAPPPVDRWKQLVEKLGADRFAQRRSADRLLRQAGPQVRGFLDGFDRSQLDAEQRFRIDLILDFLAESSSDDTPESLYHWLAVDPRVWFILLDQEDLTKRQKAAEQLMVLTGEPVEFDPAATEEIRRQQIDRLRSRFAYTPRDEVADGN